MANTIKIKRGTEATLPTLQAGELGYTTDTHKLYVGDGTDNHLIGPGTAGADEKVKADSADPTAGYLDAKIDDFTLKVVDHKLIVVPRIEYNILLNAFRIAINGSLIKHNMVDGIMDEFEDQSGINAGLSSGYYYDSANKLYMPSGIELDYMEYADDPAVQAAYVSSGGTVANPLAHYKLNDNAANTTVVDAMGNYNGAAQHNTDTLHVTGKINGALNFENATDDYVRIPDAAALSALGTMSVCGWFKGSELSVASAILAKDEGAGTREWIFLLNTNGDFGMYQFGSD